MKSFISRKQTWGKTHLYWKNSINREKYFFRGSSQTRKLWTEWVVRVPQTRKHEQLNKLWKLCLRFFNELESLKNFLVSVEETADEQRVRKIGLSIKSIVGILTIQFSDNRWIRAPRNAHYSPDDHTKESAPKHHLAFVESVKTKEFHSIFHFFSLRATKCLES